MKFFAKKLKAIGLLEILVAMLISSMILLASMSVAVRGYSLVKENELRDSANAILIRSLELSRSPFDLKLREDFNVTVDPTTGVIQSGFSGNQVYTLQTAEDGNLTLQRLDNYPDRSEPNVPSDLPCTEASTGPEKVNLAGIVPDVTICNLAFISYLGPSPSGREAVFKIVSVVVFNYSGDSFLDKLVTFRTELV